MTETPATVKDEPLTFSQFEVMKGIPRGLVTMRLNRPGSWRFHNGKDGYVVTQTMLPLLERKLVQADPTFTDGVRGCRITAAGYEAMSRSLHNKPKKKRRR